VSGTVGVADSERGGVTCKVSGAVGVADSEHRGGLLVMESLKLEKYAHMYVYVYTYMHIYIYH
jgi:hypothetical protein